MKTLKKSLKRVLPALSAFAILAPFSVHGAAYRDIDVIWGNTSHTQVGKLVTSGGSTVSGWFDIVNGDVVGSNLESATIFKPYYLTGPVTYTDVPGFTLGANEFVTGVVASFYFRDDADTYTEKVKIEMDSYDFTADLGLSTIKSKSFSILWGDAEGAITALQADGKLQYVITATDGDFYFDYAMLDVVTELRQVPDNGPIALLLGIGSLGLGLIRRKMA